MDGHLTSERMATFRRLDRIDVADDVGNSDVRRRELFDVTLVARTPHERRGIFSFLNQVATLTADGCKRVVVDFATGNSRYSFIEKFRETTQDSRLRLATKTEQDHVVTREYGIHNLRSHGVVVAFYTMKHRRLIPQLSDKVLSHLVFYG